MAILLKKRPRIFNKPNVGMPPVSPQREGWFYRSTVRRDSTTLPHWVNGQTSIYGDIEISAYAPNPAKTEIHEKVHYFFTDSKNPHVTFT
jgi:hypothetical protein